MPDGLSVEIEGLDAACKQLEEFPTVVVRRCYREALDAACVPMLQALESRIPEHTGDLRAHIVFAITIDPDGRGGTAAIGFGSAGAKAQWVEYGHRMVGHKPDLKELGQVAPHPFMRIAFEEAGQATIDAFVERVLELVNSQVIVIDRRTTA